MTTKALENIQMPEHALEEELLEAEAAEYLEYLNARDGQVKQAREQYPEEYADYLRREQERARRVLAAQNSPEATPE